MGWGDESAGKGWGAPGALGPDLETGREESEHQQTGKNNPAPKECLSSRNATCFTWGEERQKYQYEQISSVILPSRP